MNTLEFVSLYVYLIVGVGCLLASPSISVYYRERYGKSWTELAFHTLNCRIHNCTQDIFLPGPFTYVITCLTWPAWPPVFLVGLASVKLCKIVGYPGLRLAENLKKQR